MGRGPQVPEGTWERYAKLRAQGATRVKAAAAVGVSVHSAEKRDARERAREQARTQATEIERATTGRRPRSVKGLRITPDTWATFEKFVNEGWTITAAAQKVGISENSGRNRAKLMREQGRWVDAQAPGPKVKNWAQLPDRAKRAFDDFELFRRVYMGHISTQSQIDAANAVLAALKTPDESYFVMNVCPGWGKSTFLVDLAAWLTVRDRSIRGLFGSRTAVNAKRQLRRLARALTATVPAKAKAKDVRLGLACDAEATLAGDFGLFKAATEPDTWRADEFVVVQEDGAPINEKESTWMSYGMDSGFLGNRFDVIFWDDVVDRSTIRTQQAIDDQRAWWDEVAESRLEPGGAMFLVGQRMGALDLYRYCLDKTLADDTDDPDADLDDDPEVERPKMYTHIVFPAHDETRCRPENHRYDAPAWPVGCLIDPKRLSWRRLARVRANPQVWSVQYQQQDGDQAGALIPRVWITGGKAIDEITGLPFQAPGCLDRDRGLWEIPDPFGPVHVYATVDPSDRQWWSIAVWCFMPSLNKLFLIHTMRERMTSERLLDHDPTRGYSGIMVEHQQKTRDLGHPITHWIVERTVGVQHLSKWAWVKRWASDNEVRILEFQTSGANKHDPDLGVPMIRPWFRDGKIRLPYAPGAAVKASDLLIREAVAYPVGTTDQVMGCWFGVATLEQVARALRVPMPNLPRPDLVKNMAHRRLTVVRRSA